MECACERLTHAIEAEKVHKARVIHLKAELVDRLRPWMEGNVKDFADGVLAEAETLRNESYGAELLQHVRQDSLLFPLGTNRA